MPKIEVPSAHVALALPLGGCEIYFSNFTRFARGSQFHISCAQVHDDDEGDAFWGRGRLDDERDRTEREQIENEARTIANTTTTYREQIEHGPGAPHIGPRLIPDRLNDRVNARVALGVGCLHTTHTHTQETG
jgi:hypothetical protein